MKIINNVKLIYCYHFKTCFPITAHRTVFYSSYLPKLLPQNKVLLLLILWTIIFKTLLAVWYKRVYVFIWIMYYVLMFMFLLPLNCWKLENTSPPNNKVHWLFFPEHSCFHFSFSQNQSDNGLLENEGFWTFSHSFLNFLFLLPNPLFLCLIVKQRNSCRGECVW